MCGRTACTLDPSNLRRACMYQDRKGQRRKPSWRNTNSGSDKNVNGKQTVDGQQGGGKTKQMKYFPSFNIAPQAVTPVLVSTKHFDKSASSDERDLALMKWGLVPSWHKGDPSAVAFKMNNCRGEGMMEKATFKRPFQKGQRCVVLADGYYEWHTDKAGKKQPYFIYFAEQKPLTNLSLPESYDFDYDTKDNKKSEEEEECATGESDETEGGEEDEEWEGHKLLTMAGIFDVWNPPEGGDPLYSYSVITIEAEGQLAWIHHRMPVFLNGEAAVRDWLDFGSVPSTKALSMVKAVDCLACHPVTQQMGNIRYKASDCITPISLEEKKPSASNSFMSSWLKKGSTTSKSTPDTSAVIKTEKDEKPISVKKESKKTGLTSWLKKANDEDTLKRVIDSTSPVKSSPTPTKVPKREIIDI